MSNSTPNIDAMEQLGKALTMIGTVVGNYHKGLVASGMSEAKADELATDLNNRLMDQAFATPKPTPEEAKQAFNALLDPFRKKGPTS